jgi:hypothetical protein
MQAILGSQIRCKTYILARAAELAETVVYIWSKGSYIYGYIYANIAITFLLLRIAEDPMIPGLPGLPQILVTLMSQPSRKLNDFGFHMGLETRTIPEEWNTTDPIIYIKGTIKQALYDL